jgi:hypothetical protein
MQFLINIILILRLIVSIAPQTLELLPPLPHHRHIPSPSLHSPRNRFPRCPPITGLQGVLYRFAGLNGEYTKSRSAVPMVEPITSAETTTHQHPKSEQSKDNQPQFHPNA